MNGGVCLSVSGACECPAGFIGTRCHLSESHTANTQQNTLYVSQTAAFQQHSSPPVRSGVQRVRRDATGQTVAVWPSVGRGRGAIRSPACVWERKVSWCSVRVDACVL